MSESDVEAMVERMAREEQDDLDRKHGEAILTVTDYAKERQERGQDPLVQVLHQAHRARAQEDDQQ